MSASPSSTAAKARAFVEKWARSTLNERAVAQPHFSDLCDLLGHPTPAQVDPHGAFYRFEKPLTKSGGGAGFADVWFKDRFAWEYKGKGKRLDEAYRQLLLYRGDLDNPPILVTCNIDEYEVHIEFTGHKSRVERFRNEDVATVQFRELLDLVFRDPEQLRPTERTETVTTQAAARLAKVVQLLEGRGYAPIDVAPFFIQLIFTLFAEDIGLLPNQLLSLNIREAILRPDEFADRTRALFQAMRNGGYFGVSRVPRFNGGLFDHNVVIPLTADELQFLNEAAKLDWKHIEPSIFGTLLERTFDPAKRAQLGMHYTSEADILDIVEPVLMAPLRREWDALRARLAAMAPQVALAQGVARQQAKHHMESAVFNFMGRLGELKVLDAACGSGNFLYVALKRMKDLEKEIIVHATGLGLEPPDPVIHPSQFHGIEKNLLAAELAQVVVWIGYIQWKRFNGLEDSKEPILDHLQIVECRDAIFGVDQAGQPVLPEWPAADVIIGNPPFLGGSKLRRALGDRYTEELWRLYDGRVPAGADLVTYWFERARAMVDKGLARRVGLLSTQAIRTGANQKVLERIKQTGDLFMAWRDRPWVLDGADVRVSMVGFDDGSERDRCLDDRPVAAINADLTCSVDLTKAQRLAENIGLAFVGSQKIGAFDISASLARQMLELPANANGRPNSDVIVPSMNGSDLMGRSRQTWIIDFGVGLTETQAAAYEAPFKYIRTHVYPERSKNRRPTYAKRWWQHGEPRPGMRRALEGTSRFIVTSRVAKHRVFAWLRPPTLPDHKLCVIAREDDYFFGVLQARPHELWSLAKSGRHGVGDDPAYSASTAFETFPFPWLPGHEPAGDPRVEAIAAAARSLVAQRDAWLNPAEIFGVDLKQRTLTNLYNKRPDWLVEGHRRLDAAVCDAYGWPRDLADGEILERLLALNLARAAGKDEVAPALEEEEDIAAD